MSDNIDQQPWFSDNDGDGATSIPSPRYTRLPSRTEMTLDAQILSASSSPSWTYHTKHMSIDLRRRLWGTSSPTYGLNDKIEGKIEVLGQHPEYIESISITLEGHLVTAVDGDGGVSRSSSVFLNHTISLPLSRHPISSLEGASYPFSIPVPSEINLHDVSALTPPSFYRFHLGVSGEIAYSLKISMVRQTLRLPFRLEPNETKIIPILYFPKTRPIDPPLAAIPKPFTERELRFASPNMYIAQHVNTFPLVPRWSPSSPRAKRTSVGLESFRNSLFLSVPTPQSFASGERIPFLLSLVFPNNPVQTAMYTENIRVSLIKQLTVRPVKSSLRKLFSISRSKTSGRNSNPKMFAARASSSSASLLSLSPSSSASRLDLRNESGAGSSDTDSHSLSDGGDCCSSSSSVHSSHDSEHSIPAAADTASSEFDPDMYLSPVTTRWTLTTGYLETRSEYSEGVYVLRGWISAGELGRGCSWRVGQLARLQYFLRVETSPSQERSGGGALEKHLPSFVLEKEVEITTDCWETVDRELSSMGGLPTPALGLARCVVEKEGLQGSVETR
ncbi:hypothetical protein D9757_012361 [Collybiopsis confluens]|uniref:Arrestin-like N-terminal domain-containing protein n=1 Tax=Collybiopsis confluens TaxID=2823264 RepID=A0A8H5G3E9_9AGAR|nr:hypothetical protein D9757_012361 [Collybiopsis confluens]